MPLFTQKQIAHFRKFEGMKINLIVATIVWVILTSCSNSKNQSGEKAIDIPAAETSSFQPEVRYSNYFTIETVDHYKTIVVKNPWSEEDTLVSYVLYPKGTEIPEVKWAEFTISVPVNKVVTTSSPHIGLIQLIDELDKIVGVGEDQYLYNPGIYQKVNNGTISKVGSLKDGNLEVLLDLFPDLVMRTGYDNARNDDERLKDAGIPVSYNVEWMETSMLARAEWIKFIGAFFNKDEEADSIFRSIEKEYLETLNLTKDIKNRPSVMTGSNFKGTWYMPGSDSYMTKLILDAGGDYYFKNEKSTGSLPLSFEVVLDKLMDAEYWIGPRAESLKELEMMDERYGLFNAFKKGHVYTFNKRMSENGGNDYWETGMTRPDLILKDVIKIFHPDLLPNHELYYFKKLQ